MLTKKQSLLLNYINDSTKATGITPSYDEMREALCLQSKSGIHRLVLSLEERGFIRRLPNRARAIEICKLPTIDAADKVDNVVDFNKKTTHSDNSSEFSAESKSVEILGHIAAGTPIAAISNPLDLINVPAVTLKPGKNHYALIVNGDSMIEAGIFDGDTVIIEDVQNATNGDIIVALIDEQEATLKKYQQKDGNIHLIAENADYPDQIYTADRVKIQGKLAALIRAY